MTDLDADLVWASLDSTERTVVAGWLSELGLCPEDWPAVPALRTVLELLAVGRMAAEMDLEPTYAYRLAAEALGLEDDPDRDSSHHPGDRYARTLRRWHRRVEEASGQNDRTGGPEAA